jgi:membrane fusion protein (multidrug efflux system)
VPDSEPLPSFARRRRWDILIGLILIVIVIIAAGFVVRKLLRTDPTKARAVGLPLPVQTLPAAVVALTDVIGASGSIEQSSTVVLTARVTSRVTSVPVDLGSIVNVGQVVVELDNRIFVATRDSNIAKADHATKQLHRMEVMESKGLGTAVDTEKARVDDANARMDLLQAEIALANTQIASPVEGVVLDRSINPGETTNPDQKVMTLGTINPVMMVADVSEDKIGYVRLGMPAEISTNAFPGKTFAGETVKIQAEVSAKTRTFQVYIKVDNQDLSLKPGVTGYVRLNNRRMALSIPSTALMNPVGDHATVFVVDNNQRAHLREVRRGMAATGLTEILEGIKEGEHVVTIGHFELHDNDRVLPNRSTPWNEK